MNKKVVIILTLIAILMIGASVVAAQGNGNRGNGKGGNGNGGNGNGGNGNQSQVCDPAVQDCTVQQQNGNGNGGYGNGNGNGGNGGYGNQTQICDPAVEDCTAQQNGNGGYGNSNSQTGSGLNGSGMYADLPDAYAGELPEEVIDLMIEGWLDEQNAYAIYDAVIAQFGEVAPFVNIQNAEAQHAAAWEFLFDRYGIEAPEFTIGFTPEFATLEDACRAAADAETANFSLYDSMIEAFEPYPDIAQIAQALGNASEMYHLPAFESCAN